MNSLFKIDAPFIRKGSLLLFAVVLAFVTGIGRFSSVVAQETERASGDLSTLMNFSKGFSKLMKSPQQKETKDAETEEVALDVSGNDSSSVQGLPVPRNAGVILQTPSLTRLDKAVGQFFQQTSDASFSLLASLRITAYRSALACINPDRPVAVVVLCDSVPPQISVVLPVAKKQFVPFVTGLVKASKSEKPTIDAKSNTARFTLTINGPLNLVARQVSDSYIAITNAENEDNLSYFSANNVSNVYLNVAPEELNSPILSAFVTEAGLRQLTAPDRPFWIEAQRALVEAQRTLPVLADVNLEDVHQYVADNLAGFRYDLAIDDYGLYAALQLLAKPNSDAAKQLASYRHTFPLNVSADRFFNILSDDYSVVAGQADLPGSLTDALPKPLNRLSFVEYCLGLPKDNEYAASSFLFYLEVDDSDLFAREMIVPRAREIGRYIGSKQAGNAASQVFGSIAERRRELQNNSRRPFAGRLADPERAAELGNAIGSALGGLIGESAGEESAMEEHRLNGFKMYVSDIETFTRQTALMKAEKEGRYAPESRSPLASGAFSPVEALVSIIQDDGMLQRSILQSANQEASKVDQTPLFSKEGYLVILDKNRILYSLGNQDLLKLAINNYRSTKERNINYLSNVQDTDTLEALSHLGTLIPDLRNTNIIGSTRIDTANSQAYYKWLQQYYFPQAPTLPNADLPLDTPKLLLISSVYSQRNIQRFVLPHKTVKNFVNTFSGGSTLTELLFKPKASSNANSDEEEVELDFGDE